LQSFLDFLWIYFFLYFLFFFCRDPKMSYNRCPLFTTLTEQRLCVVSFIKINKTNLPKLIFSKLGWSETLFLQQSPSTGN
jgi:hypothetical protein